jgi:hypothetical protein
VESADTVVVIVQVGVDKLAVEVSILVVQKQVRLVVADKLVVASIRSFIEDKVVGKQLAISIRVVSHLRDP